MAPSRLNLPNIITITRILACPVLFWMVLARTPGLLYGAFALFIAAAVSDLWDGYLARKHGLVTDMGKFLDPLADKLLLLSTFVPFWIVSHRPDPFWEIPWWGPLPLWVMVVIFGRELFVTLFRVWAARRGRVISAGPSGKIKAFVQNIFSGALILWYALSVSAGERGWKGHSLWEGWAALHGVVVALALGIAIALTVYSMGVYLVQNRSLFRSGE